MRRERDVVRLGERGDAPEFRNPPAVRDVGLDDVDGELGAEEGEDGEAAVQALAGCDRGGGEGGEVGECGGVFGEEGFFDEEGAVLGR